MDGFLKIIAMSLFLFSATAAAQDISFRDARKAAIESGPAVQIAEAEADVSRTEVTIAKSLQNPLLSVTTAKESARLGVSAEVPLYIFGQKNAAKRAAEADAKTASLNVDAVRVEARRDASLAWIDLWAAEKRTLLTIAAAEEARQLAQIAKERFDAGTAPRMDVVRTNAEGVAAEAEADAAKRVERSFAAQLAGRLGVSPDSALHTTGTPGYRFDAPIRESVLAARLDNHPAIQKDRAAVRASQTHVEAERRGRRPVIIPQLGVDAFDPGLPALDIIGGIALEIPVFDRKQGEIARARALENSAKLRAAADERALRAGTTGAYQQMEAARATLLGLRDRVLPAMQEVRDMTEEGYRSGRIDLIQMMEAERVFLDSRAATLTAEADWYRAMAELESVTGTDLSNGGTDVP